MPNIAIQLRKTFITSASKEVFSKIIFKSLKTEKRKSRILQLNELIQKYEL